MSVLCFSQPVTPCAIGVASTASSVERLPFFLMLAMTAERFSAVILSVMLLGGRAHQLLPARDRLR